MMKKLLPLLLVAISLGACSTRVSPGYVGIQVNYSGTDRGVSSYPVVTGRVFYNPYNTSILEYPTFVQTAVWTANKDEGHPVNEEITFTNADKMKISADISLAYHLEGEKVPSFYVKFRSDNLSAFTHGFLRNLARQEFDHHGGKYSIDQIMGDNADFLESVRASLQEDLKPIGVVLDQFGFIGAPRPPQAVTDQINASVHANQLTTQKQNELAQVQADMAKKREETDTNARNALVYAEAQANANRKLSESITPNLLELKRLEKWDGKLPYINGGSTNPFVSIAK
jgi:regulator of protease activity HflC (stomatin/prohibitin superfamily)